MQQYLLPIDKPIDVSFDNFFTNDPWLLSYLKSELNASLSSKRLQPTWLYLWGPAGSGKTHLLQATSRACHRLGGHGEYCALSQFGLQPSVLEGLEAADCICLDDIHSQLSQSDWTHALFHALNLWHETNTLVLISASSAPAHLACDLPDLRSRLAWSTVYHLDPLADQEKMKALQARAQAKGFALPNEVGHFLLTHYPRDLHRLFACLDRLSQKSLEEKRPITIPFVKKVLKSKS